MSVKAKITLIIGAIIAFIGGWVIFVMSLIGNNNTKTDITNKAPQVSQTHKQQNKIYQEQPEKTKNQNKINTSTNSSSKKNSTNQTSNKLKAEKSVYPDTKGLTFTILAPKNTLSNIAWRFFQINFKKNSGGIIKYKFYENMKDYDKDLTYKLATKDDSFDFALVPAYWWNHLNKITDISFKVQNASISLNSIFDYNFENFINNNEIKAIPFSIDPIIGYAYSKTKLDKYQTFDSWKNLILNSPNRLSENGKLINMPIFLGYDKPYIEYIKNHQYSLFPIFDFILHYYFFKKSEKGASIIKDFGTNLVYKTFDFGLYQHYAIKYRKIPFCKNKEKFCLLFNKKTNLVYGFGSDYNFLRKNGINIFKKFRFNIKKLQFTSLPLANFQAEYPARGWILIINPNSKNLKNLGKFIKTFILLGQNNLLPFYKNMISPFVKNQTVPDKFQFMNNFLGRILILSNMKLNYPKTISDREINYLLGKIKF